MRFAPTYALENAAFLFFGFLENNAFAKFLRIFLKFDFAFDKLLVLARQINLACLLVSNDYELIL